MVGLTAAADPPSDGDAMPIKPLMQRLHAIRVLAERADARNDRQRPNGLRKARNTSVAYWLASLPDETRRQWWIGHTDLEREDVGMPAQ